MIVILKGDIELISVMIVPLITFGKETVQQYFENVCSNDQMNKIQFKTIRFSCIQDKNQNDKTEPSGFHANSSFVLWSS